jgi:hypothetical protein
MIPALPLSRIVKSENVFSIIKEAFTFGRKTILQRMLSFKVRKQDVLGLDFYKMDRKR